LCPADESAVGGGEGGGGGCGEGSVLRGWGKCAEHGDGVSKLVGENKTFPLFRFQLV